PTGEAEMIEFMPTGDGRADLVREMRCISGSVSVRSELLLRPAYGSTLPWVRHVDSALTAIAGPDLYVLRGPALEPGDKRHTGRHDRTAGESATWVLAWTPSWVDAPPPLDITRALEGTRGIWLAFDNAVDVSGRWGEAVRRSLLV